MKHLTADQKGSGALCFSHSAERTWLNVPNGRSVRRGKYVSHTPTRVQCGGVIIPVATGGYQWTEAVEAIVYRVVIAPAMSREKLRSVKGHVGSGTGVSFF